MLRRRVERPALDTTDIDEALEHARRSAETASQAGDQEQAQMFRQYIDSLLDKRLERRQGR